MRYEDSVFFRSNPPHYFAETISRSVPYETVLYDFSVSRDDQEQMGGNSAVLT